ncbi:DUF927 domain-containing protein [Rhodococcus baikonurensis]|uniref:DUF927 domain-containing protein n=1 Tax=Rhodococcus baikonurensis TaxID=172041 RepID=A0ABV5XSP1_9NOCA
MDFNSQTTRISATMERGLLPLSPLIGPETAADSELGRQRWGWFAGHLAPMGRLTVGAALAAPWLEARGATSALWTLVGESGAGKTVLLHTCASVYGKPSDWSNHYPLMLDDVQSITFSPASALTPIIMGAQRTRATRSGTLAERSGSWHSLAFLTSNSPLRDELTHELWGRRLIEIDAGMLWQARPTDPTAQNLWWSEIVTAHREMQGAPWLALNEQYKSGAKSALGMAHAIESVDKPGAGNIGMVTQLAVAGCQWLAHWTGNPAWIEGVADAATAVCEVPRNGK